MTSEALAYWIGTLEEADRWIVLLERAKSKPMRMRLKAAKQAREEAKANIAKLAGLEVQK